MQKSQCWTKYHILTKDSIYLDKSPWLSFSRPGAFSSCATCGSYSTFLLSITEELIKTQGVLILLWSYELSQILLGEGVEARY